MAPQGIKQIQEAGSATSLVWNLTGEKNPSMSKERGRGRCSIREATSKQTNGTLKGWQDPDSKRSTLKENWGKLQKREIDWVFDDIRELLVIFLPVIMTL